MPTTSIHIRLDNSVLAHLRAVAADEDRSIAYMAARAIGQWLGRREAPAHEATPGVMAPPPAPPPSLTPPPPLEGLDAAPAPPADQPAMKRRGAKIHAEVCKKNPAHGTEKYADGRCVEGSGSEREAHQNTHQKALN